MKKTCKHIRVNEQIFDIAEIASFLQDQTRYYEDSLKYYWNKKLFGYTERIS